MIKRQKQFPKKNILFKSTTFSLTTALRTDFSHETQTHFSQKSFAPHMILQLRFALPLIPVPQFEFPGSRINSSI
jgi:hypothetical protein